MKRIIVCMKQVLDPEVPLSIFKVDAETKRAVMPKGTPPVLSPFDENALEAALKIKDTGEAEVIVISLGRKLSKAVVKSTLAAGADELVLLEDESFDEFDTFETAAALAAAIQKLGPFDLVLCGLQAADTNAGQVGLGIASILKIPGISSVQKVELDGDKVIVEKALSDGFEVLEVQTPALVTTSYEVGALREPGVEAFMTAGKKPVTVWNAQSLGIDPGKKGQVNFLQLVQPTYDSQCDIIEGSSPSDKARRLIEKFEEIKIL